MKIKSEHANTLVLAGKPGGAVWMVLLVVIGGAITAACVWFGIAMTRAEGWGMGLVPMGVGVLIGQVMFWTGAVTLAVGKQSLTLDRVTGRGEYVVVSPIVDAGKSCKFSLSNVHSVSFDTRVEDRPGGAGGAGNVGQGATEATVHLAVLRLNKPRRSITLDETENNRVDRVSGIAHSVASFLGLTVEQEAS